MKWLDPQTLFAKPFCASLVECVRVAILNEKEAFFWKSLSFRKNWNWNAIFQLGHSTHLTIHHKANSFPFGNLALWFIINLTFKVCLPAIAVCICRVCRLYFCKDETPRKSFISRGKLLFAKVFVQAYSSMEKGKIFLVVVQFFQDSKAAFAPSYNQFSASPLFFCHTCSNLNTRELPTSLLEHPVLEQ